MRTSRLTFLLLGGALGTACSDDAGGATTVCYDCGECGIQAPVEPGTIFIDAIGVDGGANAAVRLQLQEGTCPGKDEIDFRVLYVAGAIMVIADPADDPIDTSAASYADSLYTWKDRDLTLVTSGAGMTVELTFTEASTSVKASCTGVNREIVCTSK